MLVQTSVQWFFKFMKNLWFNSKQGLCHIAALPFTLKKSYRKAKEELWKLKYFTMQKYT
jgi:hypothetical protein